MRAYDRSFSKWDGRGRCPIAGNSDTSNTLGISLAPRHFRDLSSDIRRQRVPASDKLAQAEISAGSMQTGWRGVAASAMRCNNVWISGHRWNSRRLHCISQKSLRRNDFGSGRTRVGFPPPRTSPITHQRWREPERPFPFRLAVTYVFGSQVMLQNPGRRMTPSLHAHLQRGQIALARRASRLLAQIRLLYRVGDRVLAAPQIPLPGWLFLLSVMLGRRTQEVAWAASSRRRSN